MSSFQSPIFFGLVFSKLEAYGERVLLSWFTSSNRNNESLKV